MLPSNHAENCNDCVFFSFVKSTGKEKRDQIIAELKSLHNVREAGYIFPNSDNPRLCDAVCVYFKEPLDPEAAMRFIQERFQENEIRNVHVPPTYYLQQDLKQAVTS